VTIGAVVVFGLGALLVFTEVRALYAVGFVPQRSPRGRAGSDRQVALFPAGGSPRRRPRSRRREDAGQRLRVEQLAVESDLARINIREVPDVDR
jgi:hypothetical protein